MAEILIRPPTWAVMSAAAVFVAPVLHLMVHSVVQLWKKK